MVKWELIRHLWLNQSKFDSACGRSLLTEVYLKHILTSF